MLTKQQVITTLKQYNPGKFRKLAGVFGFKSELSTNMNSLHDLLEKIPDSLLSIKNISDIEAILNLEANTGSETYRIFSLLKQQIAQARVEQQRNEFINRILHAALQRWKQSYYFDRSHSLVFTLNEIAPRFSSATLSYSEHILAVLYFVFSYYGIKNTDYYFIFAGKLSQTLGNTFIGDNFRKSKPMFNWLLGLGLQIGFDFMTGEGGLFVTSYVVGSLLEALSCYLFDTIKAKRLMDNPHTQYPNSELLLKKVLSDLAFCSGSLLGQYVHYSIKNVATTKHNSNSSSENSPSDEDSKHSNEEQALIKLTNEESNLLFNTKNCRFQIKQCRKAAFKVLQLDPKLNHDKKEIKSAYKRISMYWHPDKVQGKYSAVIAEEQMTIINSANEALKIS